MKRITRLLPLEYMRDKAFFARFARTFLCLLVVRVDLACCALTRLIVIGHVMTCHIIRVLAGASAPREARPVDIRRLFYCRTVSFGPSNDCTVIVSRRAVSLPNARIKRSSRALHVCVVQ